MITSSVRARALFAEGRIDAKYQCSPGVMAGQRMRALESVGARLWPVAGEGGLGKIATLSRSKRTYAASGEESVPYLRPYDVFDYLPQAADQLSRNGSAGIDRLTPLPGTILQTCSGRNLGPLAYADSYICRFVVSDDMLRLNIDDEVQRLYTLAFLGTTTGQALLTRNKTGNVIDHLSPDDLAAVRIPFIDEATTKLVSDKMRTALRRREQARLTLDSLITEFASVLPQPTRSTLPRDGWTVSAGRLFGRLDAAFHDPLAAQIRQEIKAAGGVRVGDVAETVVPDWYKRHYVSEEHGRCIVSGRQLLQTQPVNLQFIAVRSLNYSLYELREGTIAFGARGRADDRMTQPALVTRDRADWLASENVMRVRPKSGVNSGWLYLCFATWQVQAQVAATAHGAVVDVIDPRRLREVILPKPDPERGASALACWEELAIANSEEAEARLLIDAAVLERIGPG